MRHFLLVLPAALAACQPQTVTPSWQYSRAEYRAPLPLAYAPGATDLSPLDRRRVRDLALALPQTVVPVLYGTGPLEASRAVAIERVLDRPVRLASLPGIEPDEALLATPMPDVIVSDACRGPGERSPGGIWPGNDATAPVLLPPGCATESDIEAQVTEPRDLLRGRPLPPGAALPYAAAIEQYYESFGAARHESPSEEGAGNAGSATYPAQNVTGQNGGGIGAPANGANPLMGPLSPPAR